MIREIIAASHKQLSSVTRTIKSTVTDIKSFKDLWSDVIILQITYHNLDCP